MADGWRVIDTGLRPATQNIALDRALLEARAADEISDTLRFYRYARAVLVASRDCVAHECAVDRHTETDIAIQRRLSAGGAQFCDDAQLAFALYLKRRDIGSGDMPAAGRRICHAIASALSALGADVHWREPHDIVIDQKRIGGAGGVFDADALLYQGVLNIDLDPATFVRALRTPGEALGARAIAGAAARVTDLKTALDGVIEPAQLRDRLLAAFESEFEAEFQEGDLSLTEDVRYRRALAEIDSPVWIDLVQRPAGDVTCVTGVIAQGLEASVLHDRGTQRIKQVWFSTASNVGATPAVLALEAALRDTAVDRIERNVRAFFGSRTALGGYGAADFIAVLRRALQLPLVIAYPGDPKS